MKKLSVETLDRQKSGSIAQIIGETTRDYIAVDLVIGFELISEKWETVDRIDRLHRYFASPATGRIYDLFFINETDCQVSEI